MTAAQFLLSMINDTLDFSLLQAGKFRLNFKSVDVIKVTQDVLELIRVQFKHKKSSKVRLEQSFCDSRFTIECDSQRLRQILINLLKNASKFTFEGFVKVSVRKSRLAYW